MASVVDAWRAVDPEAALLSGSTSRLGQPVRGVTRTRIRLPHIPESVDGSLLVADAGAVAPLDAFLAALAGTASPAAILLAGASPADVDGSADRTPVIVSARNVAELEDDARRYLADEGGWLAREGATLRLLCAEATLAEPEIPTPAGLVAARIRRGVAVSVDGELRALHARQAGRALAARFTAVHARMPAPSQAERRERDHHNRDGLWLLERRIRPGASVWLFDDVPFAAIDGVAADAVASTLRALLRRRAPAATAREARARPAQPPPPPSDALTATLLAVARANGRVARAARELGVHRNTVLYRLRRAAAERGIDPRRPADALRLLAEADPAAGGEGIGTGRARRTQ